MDLTIKHKAVLTNINNRIEMHGEEKVPGIDIDLRIDDIDATQLDQLSIDGELYSTALWNSIDDDKNLGQNKLSSPRFALLKTQTIDLKLEGYKAVIAVESAEHMLKKKDRGEIILNPVNIKKIKFTPKHNGLADLTLQIQGNVHGDDIGMLVERYLGERISFSCEPLTPSLLDDGVSPVVDSESSQSDEEATAD